MRISLTEVLPSMRDGLLFSTFTVHRYIWRTSEGKNVREDSSAFALIPSFDSHDFAFIRPYYMPAVIITLTPL